MIKKILYVLFMVMVIVFLTGCKTEAITKPFTVTCKSETPKENGMSQNSKSVYTFDTDQYVTGYEVTTVSIYDDKETYELYKESTMETVNSNTSTQITYSAEGDDETNTLTFTYKVVINNEDLEKVDDKDFYRAKNILERSEASNMKCTIDGASRKQLR